MKNMKIKLNKHVELELSIAQDRILGIGAVRYGQTLLRNPQLPWSFYTESDQGVRFEDYRLVKVVKSRQSTSRVYGTKISCHPGDRSIPSTSTRR